MTRTISSLALAGLLMTSAAPAFAYQARNWPGVMYAPGSGESSTATSSARTMEATPAKPLGTSSTTDTTLMLNIVDPAEMLTRATFTKMLIDAIYPAEAFEKCLGQLVYKHEADYRLLFADTSIDHAAAKQICMAMRMGLIRGYDDGTFRPEQPINVAEASKILSRVFAYVQFPIDPHLVWYRPYVDSLATQNLLPPSVESLSAPLRAGDLKEILYRIEFGITWRPSLSFEELWRNTEKFLKNTFSR